MKMMTLMMTITNFSETKRQGKNKGSRIWEWGWEEIRAFWPEYLPLMKT